MQQVKPTFSEYILVMIITRHKSEERNNANRYFWSFGLLLYCKKDLAEKLSNERDDFQYQYVDIRAEGITKEDLQQKAGKPVETVPQIFVDQQHIGGYTWTRCMGERKSGRLIV